MRVYAFLIISVVVLGCAPEKDKMIQDFSLLHEEVIAGNLDEFYQYLSEDSKGLVDKLTDVDYLAMNENPLFDRNVRFDIVEDKSRIRDGVSHVVLGHQGLKGRVISWLKHEKEGETYKLNLIDLLQHKEFILYN